MLISLAIFFTANTLHSTEKRAILEDAVPHLPHQLAVLLSSLSLRGWSKHSIRYQLTSVACGVGGKEKELRL
jgi:hypothetical protein